MDSHKFFNQYRDCIIYGHEDMVNFTVEDLYQAIRQRLLKESNENRTVKKLLLVGKEPDEVDGWNQIYDVDVQPLTNPDGVMVVHVKPKR